MSSIDDIHVIPGGEAIEEAVVKAAVVDLIKVVEVEEEEEEEKGASIIRGFEVFFCRSVYVFIF